jgi:hypothetical protein
MYEMEGASEPSGVEGPIARSRDFAEHVTIGRQAWTNPGRLGVRLPKRRLSRTARQLGKPCREPSAPGSRFHERRDLVLADPEVSLGAGLLFRAPGQLRFRNRLTPRYYDTGCPPEAGTYAYSTNIGQDNDRCVAGPSSLNQGCSSSVTVTVCSPSR